ncbi:hypothetical protein D3C78_615320 [compost metagenome]
MLGAGVASRVVFAAGGQQVFEDQQARAGRTLRKDRLGLRQAFARRDQHRRRAAGEHARAASGRMAVVQRQVAGAGLERADDHAQQGQAARRIQGDHVVAAHASGDQAVADAVGFHVQRCVAQAATLAARHFPFRMGMHAGFEAFQVAEGVPVRLRLALAHTQQRLALGIGQPQQLGQRPLGAIDQLQQQVAELVHQPHHVRRAEVAQVVGQLQLQRLARQQHHGQRVVGVGAVRQRADAVLLHRLLHVAAQRHVLEHEQAVEQRLAARGVGEHLDVGQRQVFVLAHLGVLRLQRGEQLQRRSAGSRPGDAQRQGVDEQAQRAFDAFQLGGTPGHGDAEQRLVAVGVTHQQQGPGGLDEGVGGQPVLPRALGQAGGLFGAQRQAGVAHRRLALRALPIGQRRDLGEADQRLAPVVAAGRFVLLAQPGEEVAVRPRRRQAHRGAGEERPVVGEELGEHQATTPGVDQRVMVALHDAVVGGAELHQAQAQQRRLGEVQAQFALAAQHGVQLGFGALAGQVAEVDELRRRRHPAQHHLALHAILQAVEGRAQGRMALHHLLPGVLEGFEVHLAADRVLVLHQVDAVAALQQAVQEDALLHRRQRQDVLDLPCRYRQAVQLGLVETGQREVGRRDAAVALVAAVLDQLGQIAAVQLDQAGDVIALEAFAAEGPVQAQAAVAHLAVHHQRVGQRALRIAQAGRGAFGQGEQRVVAVVETAQVVEGHALPFQLRQFGPGEIFQHSMADALVRYRAQAFLDCLEGAGQVVGGFQADRIDSGEPADATAQVQLAAGVLAAMAFEADHLLAAAGPLRQRLREGGEQQFVDARAVGRRCLAEQAAGVVGVQQQVEAFRLTDAAGHAAVARQARRRGIEAQPVVALGGECRAAREVLQGLRPGLEACGLLHVRQRLSLRQETTGVLQVFQQHAPGHRVHRQVMDR